MFTILYQTYDDNLEHYFINCSHAQIACVEKKNPGVLILKLHVLYYVPINVNNHSLNFVKISEIKLNLQIV